MLFFAKNLYILLTESFFSDKINIQSLKIFIVNKNEFYKIIIEKGAHMKKYEIGDIRNICMVGANGSGKTQLAEAMLYVGKAIDRFGKVDEGNTTFDFQEDEIDRKTSINSGIAFLEWKGKKINIIDAPGFADFIGDLIGGLYVSDLAVINVCAFAGVEVGTEKHWEMVQGYKKPAMIFVNGMDKEHASFDKILKSLSEKLSSNIAPITIPVGEGTQFKGIINLITNKAGIEGKEVDIPSELKDLAGKYREKLIEAIASSEDSLIEKYLDGQALSEEEMIRGLKKGLLESKVVPLLAGSGILEKGVEELLDFIGSYGPSPAEVESNPKIDPKGSFAALVFKTFSEPHVGIINYFKVFSGNLKSGIDVNNITKDISERMGQISFPQGKKRVDVAEIGAGDIACAVKLKDTGTNDTLCDSKSKVELPKIVFPEPVVEMAVYPESKGEEEKIATALASAMKEDPTLKFGMNKETKEMFLSGVGSLQLDIMVKRTKSRYKANMKLQPPRIPYKETIHGKSEVQGKYKRQSGGRGQYGDCWVKIEPLDRGGGFEFVNKIFGGAIPSQYIPAIEKGIKGAMDKGVMAGYPVVDLKVTLFDGSFHEVDSSNLAFEIAGSMALRKGVEGASPCILEPIMELNVVVPDDYTGSVMGDLNSRRGRVLGMEPKGKNQVIKAHIPKGEVVNYANDLRSLTKGAGEFGMKFSHYEEAPGNISQNLQAIYQKQKEEGR